MPRFNYSHLPEHMREHAERYVDSGQPPGNFLQAVLENKLMEAALYADDTNKHYLHDWAKWLYNIPRAAWGSAEAVKTWIEHKGLHGLGGV